MQPNPLTRRQALQSAACGFGYLALAGLTASQARAATSPLTARLPMFAPRAKRVIFLFMQGAPSHVDTFDYKPELAASDAGRGSTPSLTMRVAEPLSDVCGAAATAPAAAPTAAEREAAADGLLWPPSGSDAAWPASGGRPR